MGVSHARRLALYRRKHALARPEVFEERANRLTEARDGRVRLATFQWPKFLHEFYLRYSGHIFGEQDNWFCLPSLDRCRRVSLHASKLWVQSSVNRETKFWTVVLQAH